MRVTHRFEIRLIIGIIQNIIQKLTSQTERPRYRRLLFASKHKTFFSTGLLEKIFYIFISLLY